jgi:allantoinase
MADLIIKSKRVITPEGIKQAQVCINGTTIKAVLSYDAVVDCPVDDVGEKIVMPGVVDPHVHINEPGRTGWEGFNSATKAAAAGGITTLVDMPLNSSPVTINASSLEKKINRAKHHLHVNCGFWGGIIPGNSKEIEPLIDKGALGFKAFLTHSGIDEFPNVTERDLRMMMPVIARHNLPLLVHCEISDELSKFKYQNISSYANYLASRPREWEDKAIKLMIRLCEEFACRVHIVHLSSSDSINQIVAAKQRGLPLSVETGQHYLYFNAEDIKDGQTQFKCAPPIREKENNELLWRALKDGFIDFVATDHSPAPPNLKQLASGDFMKAWGGISSLQFALPVLWTAARKRGLSVLDISKWLSENPSKLIGAENRKGKILAGYNADLIVWDEEKTFTVSKSLIQHKHKITPYIGEQLYGVVEQTYVGGVKIYDKGTFINLNSGEFIFNSR